MSKAGGEAKRSKTQWNELDKRTGDFSASSLSDGPFAAVHPFVTKLSWYNFSAEEDPFRGNKIDIKVLMLVLKKVILPRLLPFLDTYETGSELQTRPWLLALIASFAPLVTQCLDLGKTVVCLKDELSKEVKEQFEALKGTLESIDGDLGQILRHEDASLWTGLHKADITAFSFHKQGLSRNKDTEEPDPELDSRSRLVKLVAEAKSGLKGGEATNWREGGRYQNGDYLVRAALWNIEHISAENTVFGLGTSVEDYSPCAFKLKSLIKIENDAVVAVPNGPLYLAPNSPGVQELVKKAKERVALAVGGEKDTIPDRVYAVGTFYTSMSSATFLPMPFAKGSAGLVGEGALALVQALSIILCGKRAMRWTPEVIDAALKAYQDHIASRIKLVELNPLSKDLWQEDKCKLF